jgi:transposase
MCNWAILAAQKCKDLFDVMWEEARRGPLIQMDETTLQVLREPGRDPTSKSQMWVAVGYPEYSRPIVLYNYRTSKSKDIPVELLTGYKGYLQTDGYSGYNAAGSDEAIIHVGCFAHARRIFHDAFKLSKKSNTAKRGIFFIKELYKIEKELREKDLLPDVFVKKRKEKAEPVLDEFYKWLQSMVDNIAPQSSAGKAVNYTMNEWDKLIRYLEHYYLTPDNNAVERAIRPFVLGRKNWLFSNTPRGAHSSAIIYSLVETAKANKLEPGLYLRYLFTKLPYASSKENLKNLLPTRLQIQGIISNKS